jgi:hypothetical protein
MDAQRVGKGNILHTYSLQAASKQTWGMERLGGRPLFISLQRAK